MAPNRSPGSRPRSQTSVDPFLRVYQEGEFVRNFQVKPGITVVGRDPKVDIRLPHMGVSRRHFQIEYSAEGGVFLQDLKSQNGTFVNGEKAVRVVLQHADQIQVGPFELIFSFHSSATAPKIIPFPDVRTLPGVDVRKPPPPTQLLKRPSRLVRALESFVGILFMVVVAVALAWGTWRWTRSRPEVAGPPEAPREEGVETGGIPRKAPRPGARIASPPSRRKEEGVSLPKLEESLAGIRAGDLKAADRLVASAPSPSGRKESREMQRGTLESVSVEMPKADGGGKREAVTSGGGKPFDLVQYRAMLASKVGSVENCYVANAPSGGQPGKISVWLTIGAGGEIRKSGIASSTIQNPPLLDCIVQQMLATHVDPPPWDGFTVTYTFRFGGGRVDF